MKTLVDVWDPCSGKSWGVLREHRDKAESIFRSLDDALTLPAKNCGTSVVIEAETRCRDPLALPIEAPGRTLAGSSSAMHQLAAGTHSHSTCRHVESSIASSILCVLVDDRRLKQSLCLSPHGAKRRSERSPSLTRPHSRPRTRRRINCMRSVLFLRTTSFQGAWFQAQCASGQDYTA